MRFFPVARCDSASSKTSLTVYTTAFLLTEQAAAVLDPSAAADSVPAAAYLVNVEALLPDVMPAHAFHLALVLATTAVPAAVLVVNVPLSDGLPTTLRLAVDVCDVILAVAVRHIAVFAAVLPLLLLVVPAAGTPIRSEVSLSLSQM